MLYDLQSSLTFCILQIVIISGATGCGKTTQVPQFILESEIESARGAVCNIICTQPRRISAISVSERIASERGEKLGECVSFLSETFWVTLSESLSSTSNTFQETETNLLVLLAFVCRLDTRFGLRV